jgi:hypothetical protein
MTFPSSQKTSVAATTKEVIAAESKWLCGGAATVSPTTGNADDPETLSALCLSGGGIRSATFCLGVMQALAKKDMLGQFHYLSTVSGGGYIGSWLTAWIKREGHDQVMSQLAQSKPPHSEPLPVKHLRAYTNYLSPVWGLSIDSLTLATTFMRNLVLNWIVMLPLLLAALMIPRVFLAFLNWNRPDSAIALGCGVAMAALLVLLSMAYIVADLPGKEAATGQKNRFVLLCFLPLLLACILISWLAAGSEAELKLFPFTLAKMEAWMRALLMTVLGAVLYLVSVLFGMRWRKLRGLAPRESSLLDWIFTTASGAAGGLALYSLGLFISAEVSRPTSPWHEVLSQRELYATFCVPLLLAVFWVGGTLYAGLTCKIKEEDYREWWARSAACWLGAGILWILTFVLVIYAPRWLMAMPWLQMNTGPQVAGAGAVLMGILSGAAGYWSKNGAKIQKQATGFLEATGIKLLNLASLVFILALLVVLSTAISCSIRFAEAAVCSNSFINVQICSNSIFKNYFSSNPPNTVKVLKAKVVDLQNDDAMLKRAGWSLDEAIRAAAKENKVKEITGKKPPTVADAPVAAKAHVAYSAVLYYANPIELLIALMILLAISVFASMAIGINTFSLHNMYGNRLVRAYLGASNRNRERAHWFTGFNDADNLKFADIATDKDDLPPKVRKLFHIVNATLNLSKSVGTRLEWQERMAAPFTSSPLHSGCAALGPDQKGAYVQTSCYGGDKGGMSLGRAMATSGAAASPNMGYHSSKLVAFVMTFFNIRLGWWTPNPMQSSSKFWTKREPFSGLLSMLQEASAGASAEHDFVYLSDGGHFENLGLYEMVRRGCRRIVVVDAGSDSDYEFEDLQNAIRKINIDMGIRIEFGEPLPTLAYTKTSGRHVAVAKICYPTGKPGRLVYIKPVLSGDEPLDVAFYAAANNKLGRAFPHQSTADQFFNESQFESYRVLGMHSVEQSFESWDQWPTSKQAFEGKPPLSAYVPAIPNISADGHSEGNGGGLGLVSGATRGLQSITQNALLATALTVGGVIGVSGTVGLSDRTVTLKEGAKVQLEITKDQKVPTVETPIKIDEAVLIAFKEQLASTVKVLADFDSNNKANRILIEKLTEIVNKLDTAKPTLTSGDLQKILAAIKDIKIPPATLQLDEKTMKPVAEAILKLQINLQAIETAANKSLPSRTIHAVTEGGSK